MHSTGLIGRRRWNMGKGGVSGRNHPAAHRLGRISIRDHGLVMMYHTWSFKLDPVDVMDPTGSLFPPCRWFIEAGADCTVILLVWH